jgi:two-component system, OmpR family, catabolic regulation response regulator CreB
MPPIILIIEDEPTIADTLVYALKTEGFEPVWKTTGREALEELAARSVALVVLDVGLPDVNGFELCKRIRAKSPVPVLFLTARTDEIDRIVGLEIGGDDYVTKPFSPREVCARVKAILRRGTATPVVMETAARTPPRAEKPAEKPAASGGDFSHDEERCEIRFHGQRLELTRYEYRLLRALLKRRGRVYSRDELMTQAWEDPGASLDRTVDAHIKTLRAKLRAIAAAHGNGDNEPIQTHRGLGYSLRDS